MNMLINATPKPVVELIDGKAMTTSREIAKIFGKRHADVLRAIKNLECSAEFRERNFALTLESKTYGAAVRESNYYNVTKDGFVFLAMGFTGKQAAAFKEAYINAFNQMADVLQFKHNDLFLQLARAETAYQAASEQASFHGRGLRLQGQIIKPALRNGIHELIKQIQPELIGLE